jgi:hypothetical protein
MFPENVYDAFIDLIAPKLLKAAEDSDYVDANTLAAETIIELTDQEEFRFLLETPVEILKEDLLTRLHQEFNSVL